VSEYRRLNLSLRKTVSLGTVFLTSARNYNCILVKIFERRKFFSRNTYLETEYEHTFSVKWIDEYASSGLLQNNETLSY